MDFFFRAPPRRAAGAATASRSSTIRFEGSRRGRERGDDARARESHIDAVVNPRNLATDIKRLLGPRQVRRHPHRGRADLVGRGPRPTSSRKRPTIRKIVVEGNSDDQARRHQRAARPQAQRDPRPSARCGPTSRRSSRLYVEKGFFPRRGDLRPAPGRGRGRQGRHPDRDQRGGARPIVRKITASTATKRSPTTSCASA